jgi:hypothetical protein
MMKGVSPTVLWNLAPKFDQCLRQAGPGALKPWQEGIRDYVITAKKITFFAQSNFLNGASEEGSWSRQTTGRRTF